MSEQDRSVRRSVGTHVGATASALQSAMQDPRRESSARAQLARLRRVSIDDPSEPTVWDVTLRGLPDELRGNDDGPSRAERAVHAALVLFAVHAQSATHASHARGVGLGRAVRNVAGDEAPDGPVTKRFHAFATATTWTQRLHHLRGLITLMRSHNVAVDYGALAQDLYQVQWPGGVERARLQWGRDFHRIPNQTTQEN